MAGQKHQGGRNLAVGQRNLRGCGSAKRGGHAGNNLEVDVCFAECFDLFPAPAENERVSSLQANYLQAEERLLNQQRVDRLLSDALSPAAFSDVVDLR